MASSIYPLLILFICTLTKSRVESAGDIRYEDGYTVSTILDGNKFHINPHSILPQIGSSDLIILDSSDSTFYSLSFSPTPQEKVVKKLSGSGMAGYADGELGSAMVNKPESFAVDYKGNLYVADNRNHAIRKISKSGVTTIAGGYSQKPGKQDGPAKNASFSDKFELVFVPERCALMISDLGNKLVRQITLKAEDCSHGSQSVMGMASAWALLGLGLLSCLLGLIVGFVIRPCVMSRGGLIILSCNNNTWTHCLTSLGRQLLMLCLDMRNAVVSSTSYVVLRRLIFLSLSNLSLVFRLKPVEPQSYKKQPSLLDCDHLKNNNDKPKSHADQLTDLISFDERTILSVAAVEQNVDESEKTDGSTACSNSKVDKLIAANIIGFADQANKTSLAEPLELSMGLVKRR